MIVRGPRPSNNFTILPNRVLRDHRLTWRARGILVYLLSQPPGWQVRSEHLTTVGLEGRDAVRTALRELEAFGYIHRARRQNPDGRWTSLTIVSETPHVGNPVDIPAETERCEPSPEPGNQSSVNQSLLEELTMKDLLIGVVHNSKRACTSCAATGWSLDLTNPCPDCNGNRIT